MVVLTHFEKWYSTPTDDKKSIEEIKEDICREIEGATHVKVDVECIVPVSGKWALIARQLRYCSGQDDLKEKAQSYLRIYIIANHGNVEEVGQLQPVEIASKLLAASGITALEKRYYMYSTMQEQIWHKKFNFFFTMQNHHTDVHNL